MNLHFTTDTPIAATTGQKRLWLAQELNRDDSAYNLHWCTRLRGALDMDKFGEALALVQARHAVLHSRFVYQNGELWLVADPSLRSTIRQVDLRREPAPIGRMRDEKTRIASTPFVLAEGPLVRFAMFHTAETEFWFVAVVHHALFDGWSCRLFLWDLQHCYDALCNGAALPPVSTLTYSDYAQLECETAIAQSAVQPEKSAELRTFWRERLTSLPSYPLPQPSHSVSDPTAKTVHGMLSVAQSEKLTHYAKIHKTTIFRVLVALWASLVGRYTHTRDVLLATPSDQRPSGFERVMGFFVNTVPLRVVVDEQTTLDSLTDTLRNSISEELKHASLPYDQILASANISLHSEWPFAAAIVWQGEHMTAEHCAGVEWWHGVFSDERFDGAPEQSAKWPIGATFGRTFGKIQLAIDFRPREFSAELAERIPGHFSRLLDAALDHPSEPIASLSMLSESEHAMIESFNCTTVDRSEQTLCDLFEHQCALTPTNTAIEFGAERWTYAYLQMRAHKVRDLLLRNGVVVGDRVALLFSRCPEQIAAIWGVMAAGAAFVPLSYSLPTERIEQMLTDGGASWVLGLGPCPALLPGSAQNRWLSTHPQAEDGTTGGLTNIQRPLTPDDVAYVLFTSGSTGRPKGARNRHRALVNRVLWWIERVAFSQDERVLQKTPLTFDVSLGEIFVPLCVGATLVLADDETERTPSALAALAKRAKITQITFVPSQLDGFLAVLTEPLESLRRITSIGEALPVALANRTLDTLAVPLWNLYGPTEAAIEVTAHRITQQVTTRRVPIGKPISNTRIEILQSHFQRAPVGVAGELCIAGLCVADGYQNSPELTSVQFVRDPFNTFRTTAMYRTGDMARWTPTGELEFIGREDTQVKLRGVRIEIAEVESILGALDGIKECAVALKFADRGDQSMLVAWFVGDCAPDELREKLCRLLPTSMIPSLFVPVAAIPRNTSDKIDRMALERLVIAPTRRQSISENELESKLCLCFARALSLDVVYGHEDFFALGGHSLKAIQLIGDIERNVGITVELPTLFRAGSPRALSVLLQAADDTSCWPVVEGQTHLPTSFRQQRLYDLYTHNQAQSLDHATWVIEISGPLASAKISAAVRAAFDQHEALRSRFYRVGDTLTVSIAAATETVIESLIHADEASFWQTVQSCSTRLDATPFDLERGPLARAAVIEGSICTAVVLSIHHIVTDGWSMGILAKTIHAAFEDPASLQHKRAIKPEQRSVAYARFDHDRHQGRRSEARLAYWRRTLADHPRVSQSVVPTKFAPQVVEVFLPDKFQTIVHMVASHARCTVLAILAALFGRSLVRAGLEQDVLIGTQHANRELVPMQNVVGYLVDVLPLRLGDLGAQSLDQCIQRAKEVLQSARENALSIDYLVKQLWPERWLDRFLPPRWALNLLPPEDLGMRGREHHFRLANEGMPLPAFQFFDIMLYVQLERETCTFVADLSVISQAQLALLLHCFEGQCAALASSVEA